MSECDSGAKAEVDDRLKKSVMQMRHVGKRIVVTVVTGLGVTAL